MIAKVFPYKLNFIKPGGTSRGVLHQKETFFIKLWSPENPEIFGIGEAALFRGLSADDFPNYAEKLTEICENINDYLPHNLHLLKHYPSIVFGLETAYTDWLFGGNRIIFDNQFSKGKNGIRINGLIWMGQIDDMLQQVENKLENGFSCLKLKIGAIHFEQEISLLETIRKRFSPESLEIRVDANGAFDFKDALSKLERLSALSLHSIEQPIAAGNAGQMAEICKKSPLPVALDEELIGILDSDKKLEMLKLINPRFIILKPSLIGGFLSTKEWIDLAGSLHLDWWITSALESNIGLNAIAQFTAQFPLSMPQGLGTGMVFSNNIESPLELRGENLFYGKAQWNLTQIQ